VSYTVRLDGEPPGAAHGVNVDEHGNVDYERSTS
jgi:hypothetical protein